MPFQILSNTRTQNLKLAFIRIQRRITEIGKTLLDNSLHRKGCKKMYNKFYITINVCTCYYLLLINIIFLFIIVLKSILFFFFFQKKYLTNDLLSPQVSETALMLQSKSNIYVQLLEQVGLIQVGNNPDVDCDIFNVALTFKQVRNLLQLLERERTYANNQSQVFVFTYDFLGSASNLEIFVSKCDCYTINEKITLSFKSSLRSLRDYFQRIFYVPINLYLNGIAIGKRKRFYF